MKAKLVAFLFLGLSSELLVPFWLSAQTSTPNFLTIDQAYCVARPLAIAWDPTAVPARFVGDSPDAQLRSRGWTIWFNQPQSDSHSASILPITVEDGIPVAGTVFQAGFPSGPFPASFISGDQALSMLHSIPGYGTAQVLSTEVIYGPDGQIWYWGLHVVFQNQGVPTGATVTFKGSTPGDTTPLNCGSSTSLGVAGSTVNPQLTFSEPISTGTGNYFYQHTDFTIPGRGMPLVFQRSYNTLDNYSGPLGTNWTHAYNIFLIATVNGVVIKWGDGHGETFTLSGGSYVPQPGVFNTLTKNSDGTFVLARKDQTQFAFSAGGALTSIRDRNANVVSLTYDGAGNLVQLTDTVGRNLNFVYDASNRITTVNDPVARTANFQYDANNNLAQATDTAGGLTTFTYDANHRVTSITQPNGQTLLTNTYDASGRTVSQTNGRGLTTTLAYGTPNPGDTTITDARGSQTIHSYDSSLRILKITDAVGGITSFTYDASNDRTSVTNQNGKTTNFSYDGQGNVIGIVDPLANASAFTYDANNDLLTATNPKSKTTWFIYDGNGNLTRILDALGHATNLNHSGFGQLTSKTNARGNATNFLYDSFGNLTRITDALGHSTTLTYDGIGRLTSIADPNGHAASATYDALSRLVKITDPLSIQTQFAYDSVGNLLTITDAKGNATSYAYDATNDLVSVTDALGHITRYAYDANNSRITFTNAKGNATTYAYDALNRLNKITDPLSFATSYLYDSAGNVLAVTDAKGQTNQFTYDALNRLLGISYADGKTVAYSYDANGNRTTMVDSHGTTAYGYDDLDRLTSITHPGGKVVTYALDPVGNRSSLTYPDGKPVNYVYDATNRLSGVMDWLGRSTTYSYDAASNLISTAYPNQAALAFVYDAANRLTQVRNNYRGSADNPITSFTYALDAIGNRLRVTDGSGKVTSYVYDKLNELISVTSGTNVTSFTYDAAGNRIKLTAPGTSINYTYDVDDRLLFAGTASFTYDANGNEISKTQTATGQPIVYSYDAANRLVRAAGGAATSTFAYDGDGNRISQSVGTGTYSYLNDVATALPVALQESGPDGFISYAYGLGLISESSSTFDAFYQYDGLGSIVGLTDPTGKLLGRYSYDAWGQTDQTAPGPQLGTKNKFRFTGEALDPGTQLYYLRARYYDPTAGRFLAQDPIGVPLHSIYARSAYAYAVNSPSRFTDHTGLSAKAPNNANLMAMSATSTGSNFLSGLQSWLDIAGKILLNAADALTPSVTGPLSNTDTVEVLATWGASEITAAKLLKTESPSAFVNSVETYLTSGSNPAAAVRQSFIDLGFLPAAPWVSSPIESELLKLLGTYYDPHAQGSLTNESAFRSAFDDWYTNFATNLKIDTP